MSQNLTAAARLVEALVASGTASAAVGLTGSADRIEWRHAAGWARGEAPAGRPVEPATRFDLASLTKPFMATLALILDRSGELPLRLRVGDVFPGAGRQVADRRLEDLLRHRAGFQAWTPLYARCGSLAEVEALLLSGELGGGRAGRYSDLDYLVWGLAAERVLGQPLAALVGRRVLEPLGIAATTVATPGELPDVAQSHMDTGREVELAAFQGLSIAPLPAPPRGLPQDGNARFLTGLAAVAASGAPGPGSGSPVAGGGGAVFGHGGLFGPAEDLWRLGAEWLAPGRLLEREAVAAALGGGGPFALGWWRRRYRGGGGAALSPGSFGHTGFAGGSLWIDPERSRVHVLLAHRRDPAGNLNRWRRRFHGTVAPTKGGRTADERP